MFGLHKIANFPHSPFRPKSFARSVIFLITLILAFAASGSEAQAQNGLPRLRVSSNSHFLETADGVPIFLLADTAWFLPKLNENDIDLYFADAAAKKFNSVLIDLGYYFFEQIGDPPFLDSQCCIWDPDNPNEVYWQKVDRIIDRANAHGVYVALTVMWGNDYFVEFGGGNDVDKAYRFGKWLGQRYGNRDNVLWSVAGEYGKLLMGTYNVFDNMGRGIRDGGGTQPITIHPTGGSSSSKDFQNADWLDFNLLQSGYDPDADVSGTENYQLIDQDYHLFPTKPSMEGEPIYEETIIDWFINHNPNGQRVGSDLIRRKAYWGVFAGGFGHSYGNLSIENLFDPSEPVIDSYVLPYPLPYWKDALNDTGRLQMRYLRSLIESQPILGRIPDQSILVSDPGTGNDHVQATRATNGSYAWIYIPTGGAVSIQMAALAGPSVNASWYSPRDGSYTFIGQYSNSGISTFDAPGNTAAGNDWVLVLESTGGGLDTTPPVISSVAATNITSSSASIRWTTNEPADGQVELLFPCSSGCLSSIAPAFATSHTFDISSLAASTTYTFRVRSRDAAGNLALSTSSLFTTLDPAGNATPTGYWKLNDGVGLRAADSSGNGNDGILVNGPVWTTEGSRSALLFDGVDDYVDVGNPAALRLTGPMTLSAWVKPRSTVNNGRILSKGAGPGLRGWSLGVESYNAFEFYLATDTSTITALVDSTALVPLGAWVHVVGVYEPGSALRIYINGALDNSTTTGVPRTQFDSPLNVRIGARGDGSSFDGSIDDVRIYNRALTASEVHQLYLDTNSNNDGSPQSAVAISGTPQSATVGTTFANALQAKVSDASSNPVSGVTVTFAAPSSGAGATFGGSTSVTTTTNAAGIATSPVPVANAIAGRYSVAASVAGLTPATFDLTNTAATNNNTGSTIFGTAAPSTFVKDPTPVEVGVKFRSDVSGTITGVRFYRGLADTTTHTGSLWSANGTLLATGTFTGGTASGWQQLNFSAQVPIVANTTYIASTHSGGPYYASENYFQNTGVDNPPLHALRDGADGINGVFIYGSGGVFPNQGFLASNFWVDVVFVPSGTVSSQSIAAVSGMAQNATVGTAFANALQAKVTDGSSNPIAGVTVTFAAPASGASATFNGLSSVTVSTDAAGIATSPVLTANSISGSYSATASAAGITTSATFSLANTPATSTGLTIFNTTTPQSFFAESIPVELGVKFQSDAVGLITGIRYFKSSADPTTHTGSLWSGNGALLAAGTFVGGTASGWQQLNFPAPVPISANTTYVASTHSGGPYFASQLFFQNAGVDNGPLHALQDGANGVNGVFIYGPGGTFPNQGFLASNFWVDVVFAPSGSASLSPQSVAAISGTPQSATVGSAFGSALQAKVTDTSSNPIAGVPVTFTAPVSGANATFNGSSAVTITTNAAGIAASPAPVANAIAGSYSVTASVAGLTPATFDLTNTAATTNNTAGSTIFGTATPTTFVKDKTPVEVGVKFQSDASGTITAVRFYRGLADTTTHTGSLWSAGGTLLATGTFTGGSASGWQQLNFSTPVTIAANTIYIASTHTGGPYYASETYFQNSGVDNPPLHALQDGINGVNGVYIYGPGGLFPTQGYAASNYWVDVVFVPSGSGSASAQSVVAISGTPQSTALGTAFAAALQAKVTDGLSNPLSSVTVTFTAPSTGAAATFGGSSSVTVTTDAAGIATSPIPAANSVPGSYNVTASVSGIAAPATFNLTNSPAFFTSVTIFGTMAPSAFFADTIPVELGVKFRSDVSGTITGVRFYRATADPTTHTGSLWSATGTLLATGTFTDASSSGWQQLNFSTPVSIAANTTYVASTHSGGPYFASENYFQNAGVDSNPLHALQDGVDDANGVFFYGPGGIFPNQGYGASNFWVDVVFAPSGAASSPSVAAVLGTPQTAKVSTTFANALHARVTDASLNPMSGVAVTFAAPASGAGATFNGLSSATVNTNGAGTAISPVPVANAMPGSYTVTVSAAGITIPATFTLTNTPAGSNLTIFGTAAPTAFFAESTPVEVGVKFRSDVAGTITGIRFYKSSADSTAHTGSLWSATGTLLATGTFTGGTSSGWQVLTFVTPVAIAANTTYIAATHSGGPYFASENYFQNAGVDNAPLHALKDGANGSNGVFVYGPGGIFPTFGYLSSNFWVDVVFVPSP